MSDLSPIKIIISENDCLRYKRLDRFLGDYFSEYSRSLIKKLFEDGHIKSKSHSLELKKMPPPRTEISFAPPIFNETDIEAQNIPLKLLFEDEHLIILNKPQGLVVHPAPGNYSGTLVNALLYHCPDIEGIGNEKRPGIVHRLDKGTSGVMVVAKNQKTHEGLVKLFSTHSINRIYEAIVLGAKVDQAKTISSLIGRNPKNRLKMTTRTSHGKEATTHLKVLKYFSHCTHLELKLETGRTHQIRVHLSEILNTPILNDLTYGRTTEERKLLPKSVSALFKNHEHPFLHAKTLGFIHPITKEYMEFNESPPSIFDQVLSLL